MAKGGPCDVLRPLGKNGVRAATMSEKQETADYRASE